MAECPGELARSLAAYGNSRPGGPAPGLLTRRMEGMPVEPILVVDDDPTCLCIMTDVLERAGYRVEAANDGFSCKSVCSPRNNHGSDVIAGLCNLIERRVNLRSVKTY